MQSTNVSKNDMAEKRRGPAKTKSIGEVILPGGPKGPFSKLSQATMKDNDGVKRTSVALLKYNPGLAKSRQADKQKRNSKKASETEEEQLWSTIPGGTEVHFSGHAIRHFKPPSESSPSKKSVERKSSLDYSMKQVDYPMKQMDYPMKEINQEIMRTFPQRKPPQKQSNSQHSPGPWMEPRKASQNSASSMGQNSASSLGNVCNPPTQGVQVNPLDANQDFKIYRGPWACLQYLCDLMCCQPQKKTIILQSDN
ncbi:uncharacterized protein LOC129705192 [Leucoraja erinacea]|uniref:uncharacterized protein LOC129705192 n=1 Tax=Leucoraja erinaceus TaxID=7782 RepID=UPI002454C864|nr:uncharacterized protein LOC129705192 [Leucoraja erinacea]